LFTTRRSPSCGGVIIKNKIYQQKLNSKSSDGRARRAISIINNNNFTTLPAIEKKSTAPQT